MSIILLAMVSLAQAQYKFLLLNDIHLAPNLTQSLTESHIGNFTDFGYQGGWNVDSTVSLMDKVLDQSKLTFDQNDDNISAVLISGDFIRHNLCYGVDQDVEHCHGPPSGNGKPEWTEADKIQALHVIWNQTHSAIQERYPNVPIIPTFGNNDFTLDYYVPWTTDDKQPIFTHLYDIWFKNVTANMNLITKYNQDISTSFNNGGYYKFDLDDQLSIMAINSVYWSYDIYNNNQVNDLYPPEQQIVWIENILKQNSLLAKDKQRKFIFMSHIPASLNYYKHSDPLKNPMQQFLNQNLQQKYLRAIQPYQSQIVIHLASHIHRAQIKAPLTSLKLNPTDTEAMKLDYVIFQSPSITPIYDNNPSFSLVELNSTQGIKEITSWSYQIYRGLLFNAQDSWTKIEWMNDFAVNLNSAESVKMLYQRMMHDTSLFTEFEAKCYGLAWYETQMHRMFQTFYNVWLNPQEHHYELCVNSYMEYSQELLDCLEIGGRVDKSILEGWVTF